MTIEEFEEFIAGDISAYAECELGVCFICGAQCGTLDTISVEHRRCLDCAIHEAEEDNT